MFKLNHDIICDFVDLLLDRKTRPTFADDNYSTKTAPGIILSMQCSISTYDSDETIDSNRIIWMLFTGNTSVFVADNLGEHRWGTFNSIPTSTWINSSNHDSCWRSDGFRPLRDAYFEMCEEINQQRETEGLERMAPADMSYYNNLNIRQYKNVMVTTTKDENGVNPDYHRKILNIKLSLEEK